MFGSRSCHCRAKLEASLRTVAHRGGAVVYLRRRPNGAGGIVRCSTSDATDAGAVCAIANELRLTEVALRTELLRVVDLSRGGVAVVDAA